MKIPNNTFFATVAGATVLLAGLAALYALSFAVMPILGVMGWQAPPRMAAGTPGGMALTAYAAVIAALVFFALRLLGSLAIAAFNRAADNPSA